MAVAKLADPKEMEGQRGDATRKRLIEAAIEIFATNGFDGASTRMLAERARANLGAIPYYFGSKAGLYQAAAQYIADGLSEKMLATVTEVELALRDRTLDREQVFELLDRLLIKKFAAIVLSSAEADNWSYFIVREQMRPQQGFEILYRSVMARIQRLCVMLVARLLKLSEQDPRTAIRAFAMFGEIMIFRTSRAGTMRRLGWSKFTDERLSQVQAALRENFRQLFAVSGRERK